MAKNTRSQSEFDVTTHSPTFHPMMYNFQVEPQLTGFRKTFALQLPFATLFDNLIAVLWSVYCKQSTFQIGVNQLQWSLEFLKCMRVDYGYPESVEMIVNDLEDRLIELYAKIGVKINETRQQTFEMDREQKSKTRLSNAYISYNEKEIMEKLSNTNVPTDAATGEVKYLKELNLLGQRKPKVEDVCATDKKSTKHYVIGALQKILHKTTDLGTKSGVQELIKELKVDNTSSKRTK